MANAAVPTMSLQTEAIEYLRAKETLERSRVAVPAEAAQAVAEAETKDLSDLAHGGTGA